MNNNEIFLEFWRNHKWPEPKPIFYRLYYNDAGHPLFYSMEDMPGKYIEITPEQYMASEFRIQVRNGQIHPLPAPMPPKLVPSNSGTSCHPADVSIIAQSDEHFTFWNLKIHETN